MGEVHRCEHSRMKNWVRHNCRNAAKVERDGRHYCGTHDPVARKEKQVVRDAARRQKWADHMESRPRYTEAQYAALEARVRELEAREEVLQRALNRWLPEIAGADELSPMHKAASEDSLLLMGMEVTQEECYGHQVWERAEQAEAALSVVRKLPAKWRSGGPDTWCGTPQAGNCADELSAAIAHGGAGEGEGNGR